jgi:nickel-dependent lactate racemase
MNEFRCELPWGEGQLCLDLPPEWQLLGVLEPMPQPGVADVNAEVRRALAEPVASTRLRELVTPGMQVALVIDDGSRPTPVSSIVPAVLAELDQAGVSRASITVVTALGLHRAMSEDEIAARVGAEQFAGLRWENHDCDDRARLAYLGETTRGTPVWISATVAGADLVISIGCIEPHIIASFGGGYKNLIPGVAGRETVAHNHTLNCTPRTYAMVGQPIERNPMRLDLEEGGRMLAPPVFLVNAVLNASLQVVRVVAGDPVAAHRAGAAVSEGMYGVNVPAQADVVIANSRPMDQDLRQGVKALGNAVSALRPGGTLIAAVRATEGVGTFGLAERRLPLGRGALQALAPLLLPLVPRIKLSSLSEEDRFFLYFALQAMRRGTLLMYAPTIPAETRAALPFVRFAGRPEDALAMARRRTRRGAKVLVFPHGGTTYPILP